MRFDPPVGNFPAIDTDPPHGIRSPDPIGEKTPYPHVQRGLRITWPE
jgi:hypothetical protein